MRRPRTSSVESVGGYSVPTRATSGGGGYYSETNANRRKNNNYHHQRSTINYDSETTTKTTNNRTYTPRGAITRPKSFTGTLDKLPPIPKMPSPILRKQVQKRLLQSEEGETDGLSAEQDERIKRQPQHFPIKTTINNNPFIVNTTDDEDQLDSHSNHKRALHEANGHSIPIPIQRGIHQHRVSSDTEEHYPASSPQQIRLSRTISESYHKDDSSNSSSNNNTSNISISTQECQRRVSRATLLAQWKLWRSLRKTNPIFLLLVVGVSMLGVGLYTKSYATLSLTLDQVTHKTQRLHERVEGHFDNIEREMHHLQRKLLELDPDAAILGKIIYDDDDDNDTTKTRQHSSSGSGSGDGRSVGSRLFNNPNSNDVSSMQEEIVAVRERMRIDTSRKTSFEKHIQEMSHRYASNKYGSGTLRVKLELEFLSDRVPVVDKSQQGDDDINSNKGNNNTKNTDMNNPKEKSGVRKSTPHKQHHHNNKLKSHQLVLEMASLDLMPHSVYTFLEMVDAGLFDGCSFILNAMNVIKAAPLPYEKGVSPSKIVKAFERKGLDTVWFKEYSKDYPHEQYTVGFAADGSPSFYINTDDNTDELHADEPCFARIVSGFDTLEKMKREPTRSGMFYKKRIGIKRATIL